MSTVLAVGSSDVKTKGERLAIAAIVGRPKWGRAS